MWFTLHVQTINSFFHSQDLSPNFKPYGPAAQENTDILITASPVFLSLTFLPFNQLLHPPRSYPDTFKQSQHGERQHLQSSSSYSFI